MPNPSDDHSKAKVKDVWVTGDEDLVVLLQDKRQLVLMASAVSFLFDEGSRDADDKENDFPGVPVTDDELLDDLFCMDKEDARKIVNSIFLKYELDEDERAVDEIVEALALKDDDDEPPAADEDEDGEPDNEDEPPPVDEDSDPDED
jgi:hypothetical protein